MVMSSSLARIYPVSSNASFPIFSFSPPLSLRGQMLNNHSTVYASDEPHPDTLTKSDTAELGFENLFPQSDDSCPNQNAMPDAKSGKSDGTKISNTDAKDNVEEPYILTRDSDLPTHWDCSSGIVVLVNKPKGWTSYKVCEKLRRLVKVKKVGHAGTLDPSATGLLIVCIGKATKSVVRFQNMNKGYSGVFRLGEATSSLDCESPVIQHESWEHIEDDDIKKASASFYGETWQVPPMFSAIQVKGERMYKKARRGESIELSPRKISISQFDIKRCLDDRQNLIFSVTCSKGTYIRSLCADFGKALGSCAYLAALQRDSIGQFSSDEAWGFEDLVKAVNEKKTLNKVN